MCIKTGEVEWIVSEKWYNRWLRLLNMLFPGRICIARAPGTKEIFATSSCQIYVKTKKSPTIWAPGPGTVPYGKYSYGGLLHYVHKKFRWGPEVATFRTKTLDFTLVIRLNWLEKIELRGCAGPPGRQYYLLLITVVRVYCCTQRCRKKPKMKKQGFFVKFLSLVAFRLKRPGPPGPPP